MASLKLIRSDGNAYTVPDTDVAKHIREQITSSPVLSSANGNADKYILTIYFEGDFVTVQSINAYCQVVQQAIDSCDLHRRVILLPIWKGLGIKAVELSAISSTKTHKFKYRKTTKGESADVRN